MSYWLPKKFNIDKRKITLSAQILSGNFDRIKALNIINSEYSDENQLERDRKYVLKKLDMNEEEFIEIWNNENKTFLDYPSYFKLISKWMKILKPIIGLIYPLKPMALFEIESREDVKQK